MALEFAAVEQTLKKVPTPVLIAGAGAVVLIAWWLNRQSSSSGSSAAPALTPFSDTLPNSNTPQGPCPPYQPAMCSGGTGPGIEQDQNGCPISVCSQPNTTGSGGGSTPVCHSTQHGGIYVVGHTGPLVTLRSIFAHVGQDVNCAAQWNPSAGRHGVGLDDALWSGFVVYY